VQLITAFGEQLPISYDQNGGKMTVLEISIYLWQWQQMMLLVVQKQFLSKTGVLGQQKE